MANAAPTRRPWARAIGAVVRPCRQTTGRGEPRHRHCGCDRADDGRSEQDVEPPAVRQAPPDTQDRQHDERPDEVELLLDRQRPRVEERRRLGDRAEVRRVAADEVPVADVEDRGRGRRHDVDVAERGRPHRGDDPDHRNEEEQRGQQPPGPPPPEPDEGDRPVVPPLRQEQRRDQEPGEREERVDAVVAAGEPREVVERDDPEDGDRPQPVEARLVAEPWVIPPADHAVDRPSDRADRCPAGANYRLATCPDLQMTRTPRHVNGTRRCT